MTELTRPWLMLDLADGEERTFTVLGAERGEMVITPLGSATPKRVQGLRLFVRPEDVLAGPPYFDTAAATLRAQLEGQLFAPTYAPRVFTIGKIGIAPAARFTVRSRPQEVESRS
jgi:hypothetical protein